ncbi:MAG: hypothetical protein ACMZI0_00555 [Symbiopectobacterium sp.]|uniref:hypothetical protein n=1 Tax=Symbiopectobacterium sp. TaxID=2952789 RepID=UPI0039EAAE19
MSYVYSFFSLISLIPLYFWVRKLTSSFYPITVFGGILVHSLYVLFHIIVLRTHQIPILGIPIAEDNDFMYYALLGFAILCAVVSMCAHGKERD